MAATGTLTLLAAGCGSSPSSTATPVPTGTNTGWVQDTVRALNVFLPDGDSAYYFDGFGTDHGARTVISGAVPDARYWSFTVYPQPPGPVRPHVHDSQVRQTDGRYTVTIAADCRGVAGTCLATGSDGPAGVVVYRLYVPVDMAGAASGGVPLPDVAYVSSSGRRLTLSQAAGTPAVASGIDALRNQHGALPAALQRSYPPAAPVPVPQTDPPPSGVVSHGGGPYANPDNVYDHVPLDTGRGDLVLTATAPTYQEGPSAPANDLGRPPSAGPDVRYWSLCVVLKGRHTGACLRDEQLQIPRRSATFTVIVAPSCPVAGYANCLVSGPQALQSSVSDRNLLPRDGFAPFTGPYALAARYVARP